MPAQLSPLVNPVAQTVADEVEPASVDLVFPRYQVRWSMPKIDIDLIFDLSNKRHWMCQVKDLAAILIACREFPPSRLWQKA